MKRDAHTELIIMLCYAAMLSRMIMGGPITARLIEQEVIRATHVVQAYQRRRMANALRALLAQRQEPAP